MLTNNLWVVKVEKSDRRYACFDVSGEKIGNKEYFQTWDDALCNTQGGKTIFDYLMTIDLSNFDASQIPQTAFRQEMMDYSGCVTDDFVNYLASDEYDIQRKTWNTQWACKKDPGLIKMWPRDLYSVYTEWVQSTNVHNSQQLDYKKFLIHLHKLQKSPTSGIVIKQVKWKLLSSDKVKGVATVIIDVKLIKSPMQDVKPGVSNGTDTSDDNDTISTAENDLSFDSFISKMERPVKII